MENIFLIERRAQENQQVIDDLKKKIRTNLIEMIEIDPDGVVDFIHGLYERIDKLEMYNETY